MYQGHSGTKENRAHVGPAGRYVWRIRNARSGPRTATALALYRTASTGLDREDLILLFQRKPEAALNMTGGIERSHRKADVTADSAVSRNANEEWRFTPRRAGVADWIALVQWQACRF